MTPPLATQDRCLCLCHGPTGVERWQGGGCVECFILHPPGGVLAGLGSAEDRLPDHLAALDAFRASLKASGLAGG